MRAAVLHRFGAAMEMRELELQPPRRGEVSIAVRATGVCHSDLATAEGKLPHDLPCVLGHEAAGVVEEVGPEVTSVAPGDPVVVMFKPMCGDCYFCRRGQPQLCQKVRTLGLMDDGTSRLSCDGQVVYHGMNTATFAERAVLREGAVVKIPRDVPFEIAAVAGCAVLTGLGAVVYTAGVRPGESVAVVGCGGVGMNVLQGARLAGAHPILAVDQHPEKLASAASFGATEGLLARGESWVEEVKEATGGRGADVVFEVVGSSRLQELAVEATRPGGATVLVGLAPESATLRLPTFPFAIEEKRLLGCFYGSSDPKRDLGRIFELWRGERLDLEGLIETTRRLDDINHALAEMARGAGLRTVLVP